MPASVLKSVQKEVARTELRQGKMQIT